MFFFWKCCLHQDLNDLTKIKSGSIMVRSMAWGALLFQSWNPPPEHHFTPHLEAINFSHEWKGGRKKKPILRGLSPTIIPWLSRPVAGGGFKFNFWNFHPEHWGRFPIWRIFFRWVGSTTNYTYTPLTSSGMDPPSSTSPHIRKTRQKPTHLWDHRQAFKESTGDTVGVGSREDSRTDVETGCETIGGSPWCDDATFQGQYFLNKYHHSCGLFDQRIRRWLPVRQWTKCHWICKIQMSFWITVKTNRLNPANKNGGFSCVDLEFVFVWCFFMDFFNMFLSSNHH